jgi:hypothetical protein
MVPVDGFFGSSTGDREVLLPSDARVVLSNGVMGAVEWIVSLLALGCSYIEIVKIGIMTTLLCPVELVPELQMHPALFSRSRFKKYFITKE